MNHRTIPNLFETSVASYGGNVMMWEKTGDRFTGTTYSEIHEAVLECAAGFIALGINREDRIAMIAEGRNDWVIGELGILYAGAINVPLSVKLSEPNDIRFRLIHSGSRMIIVSGTQAAKIRQLRENLPELEKIILMDPQDSCAADELFLGDLRALGRNHLRQFPAAVDERRGTIPEQQPATICYTSGTTADPKGVTLTHRNYTANVDQASAALDVPQYYTSLLILPWDHCFAHVAGVYMLMRNGASMASVPIGKTPMETLRNIPAAIKETRPVFLLSVPTLAKNFKKNIETAIRQKGPRAEKLFNKALELAYEYNGIGWDRGKRLRFLKRPMYVLYDKLIFSKIREVFGGRLQFFIGGGALLDIELQRFFYAIGIPMFQGYGLTESTPVISTNVPKCHKLGSSGRLVPNLAIRICDDQGRELPPGVKGEIVVKGENVMAGYWRNEKATAETVKDGWLYTGDMGYMDKDGFLYVLGRYKSLLISNDGEKYSPEGIEETIVGQSAIIDQIMLYNNQSPYTTALIVPNKDNLLRRLKERGFSPATTEGQDAALQMFKDEIDAYNDRGEYAGMFPARWLPSAFAVVGEAFTEQNGLMNSTMKMVRGKIETFYRDRLDHLYTPAGQNIFNELNRTTLRRLAE